MGIEKYFKRCAHTHLSPPSKKSCGSKELDTLASSSQIGTTTNRTTESANEIPVIIVDPEQSSHSDRNGNNSIDRRNIDFGNIPADPGLRIQISEYHPNDQDQVRMTYLQMGPCQPRNHTFPSQKKGNDNSRRFNPLWFSDYDWLEYSIAKDKVFCMCCYFFKSKGADNFVKGGFSSWKRKERLHKHVGCEGSGHNTAKEKCEALVNPSQHIVTAIEMQSDESIRRYVIRLRCSIQIGRILLPQGLPFRGHDESEDLDNRGHFLDILECLGENNKTEIKPYIMENAPANWKMTSRNIQKYITSAISYEIISAIMSDIGDSKFSILVYESKDISNKEQMGIVLRYVKEGNVIEHLVGIEHVTSTTALSLKETIDNFFSKHGLCISMLRGQGFDKANNMRGEYNGLKQLILNDNAFAYYIHCFAHQLQLAVVAVATRNLEIKDLFSLVTCVTNVVGGSPKHLEILRKIQGAELYEAHSNSEIETGKELNQLTNLKRATDTRWGSYLNTLISLISLYSPGMGVLREVSKDKTSDKRYEALGLVKTMKLYSFVFGIHLMRKIMGITSDLSEALQRKDQDILNAMKLVSICKKHMQEMRDEGWDSLLVQVSSFCAQHGIKVINMDDENLLSDKDRPKRNTQKITNMYVYRSEIYYAVIDMQLKELNNRFTETTTELLLCVSSLCSSNLFSSFDKDKLMRLAQFYPRDFSTVDLARLEDQLENYIRDMRTNTEFSGLHGITDLAKKMVKTKKDIAYLLVYLLLTLALILPVATATVEKLFSAMKILKTRLRNRMGDEWLNDCLLAYVEREILNLITDEMIMERLHKIKNRKGQLSKTWLPRTVAA